MLSSSNISRCVDDVLICSTIVGPVFVGERYYCSVTAINADGSEENLQYYTYWR